MSPVSGLSPFPQSCVTSTSVSISVFGFILSDVSVRPASVSFSTSLSYVSPVSYPYLSLESSLDLVSGCSLCPSPVLLLSPHLS